VLFDIGELRLEPQLRNSRLPGFFATKQWAASNVPVLRKAASKGFLASPGLSVMLKE
jgi:hypothetical protein